MLCSHSTRLISYEELILLPLNGYPIAKCRTGGYETMLMFMFKCHKLKKTLLPIVLLKIPNKVIGVGLPLFSLSSSRSCC